MDTRERPRAASKHTIGRRRFMAGLGALAGAGVLAPLLNRTRAPRPVALETSRRALGSWMRVVVRSDDEARARRATEAAFAAVARVDAQMSIHRPDSQIARVNTAAGRRALPVDRDVLDVVERALAGAAGTGGAYDPTILPLMRLYGFYGSAPGRPPSDAEVRRALDRTGAARVLVDRSAGTLGLTTPGAALDLGSIGKGWALDRAVEAMRAEGVTSGLVDLGGNVYGIGSPDGHAGGWAVGLAHPGSGRVEHVFELRDMAVATSGNSEQHRTLGPVRVGHLFDARTGLPSDGHLSASVVATSGMDADMLSTVAFLTGRRGLARWPDAREAHFIG